MERRGKKEVLCRTHSTAYAPKKSTGITSYKHPYPHNLEEIL
jgi:hypothetical protein